LFHDWIAEDKFFALLEEGDARAAAAVKTAGCRYCGGRLDRADYPRKPRGGSMAAAGEGLVRRISFCCAQEGCRRRATPPSLVFLGRKVYLGIVVVVASLLALTPPQPPPRPLLPPPPSPSIPPPTPQGPASSPSAASSPVPSSPAPSPPPRRTVRRWLSWFQTELPKTAFWQAARGRLWPPVAEQELPRALVERFIPGRSVCDALLSTLGLLSPLSTTTG
jgi:hypothetical protein